MTLIPYGAVGVRHGTKSPFVYPLPSDSIRASARDMQSSSTGCIHDILVLNIMLTSEPAVNTSDPWTASPWNDLISDTSGAGVLNGTSGNDLFVEGAAADRFITGSGQDSIANFTGNKGDTIDLSAFPAFQSLANIRECSPKWRRQDD